jgi:monofunctional biosynthetic peptidoglycan transglycosylase
MVKKTSFAGRVFRWIRNLVIFFLVFTIGWTLLAGFIPVMITPLMVIRSVEAVTEGRSVKNSKDWVSIDQISPQLVKAVIASEDNLFMEHNGFSVQDMRKAWEHNKKGKRIRGGSTISQQTAKNVFLWNKRSYVRKGLEAYFTVLIELFWSKKRIMEVYLNVIEMGDGIYGAQAAAMEYFGKDASELTRRQAAAIAVCLPNPRKFSPVNPSSYIRRRTASIVSLMSKLPAPDFMNESKSN